MFEKLFVRDFEAADYLESFILSAVSSVLLIRFYLFMTGFPKIGSGEFHIAHILWGGVFMLLSFVIVFSFLTKTAKSVAAVLGGIGFGAFIDELGKFITSDNNYFYQPAVAIIYILFVLLYLSVQSIERFRATTRDEYIMNSLEMVKEGVIDDLDDQEKKQALDYLKKAGSQNERSSSSNEITLLLRKLLGEIDSVNTQHHSAFVRFRNFLSGLYRSTISYGWFIKSVIFFFVVKSLFSLFGVSILVDTRSDLVLAIGVVSFMIVGIYEARFSRLSVYKVGLFAALLIIFLVVLQRTSADLTTPSVSFSQLGQLAGSVLSSTLVVAGIIRIRYSRLSAYETFKISVLVSIFITQFFAFYRSQFYALFGLLGNLIVLLVLRYVISRERMIENSLDSSV